MVDGYLSSKELEAVAKKSAPFILKKFISIGNSQYEKVLVNTEICFTKYLQRYYNYYSKIRTLLYRDTSVSLKDHYVQTSFTYQKREITKNKIFPTFNNNKKNIVIGTAGAGKSVFMKRFFLDLIDSNSGYIPILIELRLLKKSQKEYINILDFALSMLTDFYDSFTLKQLKYALNNGKIALLLDGFDEIDNDERARYTKEILELSKKYDKTLFVITSRPDDTFNSWNEFHILRTNDLKKEEAVELISKINYNEVVKNKFIDELNKGLFKKHIDFTSNPLLLTMMLLTYEQLAEIPEKIHIFYSEAFNTLFHKHDAYKEMYKRKFYSKLAIDDFKRVFSTFCILTYSDNKISFSSSEVKEYIAKALKLESIENEKPINIIKDLTESICILQKDGHQYTFSHRSFQEYFSAYYISQTNSIKDVAKLLDKLLIEHQHDNVLSLLKEMNLELIEQELIVKKLNFYIKKLKKIDIKKNPYKFIQVFTTSIRFNEKDGRYGFWISANATQYTTFYFFNFIKDLYHLYVQFIDLGENKKFIAEMKIKYENEVDFVNDKGNNIENKALNQIMIKCEFAERCEKVLIDLENIHKKLEDKYNTKKEDLASYLF